MQIDLGVLRRALALKLPPRRGLVFESPTPAAVLLPVLLGEGDARVVMLFRAPSLRDHASEVGFPGGKPEAGDVDLEATALREAEEEVALGPLELEVLGPLVPTPVITGKFLIHPFVAAVPHAQPRIASPEIARLFEVPLLPFVTGERPTHANEVRWEGRVRQVPHFRFDDVVLYGASAVIFHELLERVATTLGRSLPPAIVEQDRPWGDRYG